MKRTALILGCLLPLAATFGCNEDPRRGAFTMDVGTEDTSPPSEAEKWYQTACETTSPREISVEENGDGNWAYALPRSASEYRNLQLSGFEAPHAAAIVESNLTGVSGALLSRSVAFGEENAPDAVMRDQIASFPEPVAEKIFGTLGGPYETHGGRRVTIARFLLKADAPMTVDAFRNLMLVHFADFDRDDVESLGDEDGETHSKFRVYVTLQTMPTPETDRKHGVYSMAVSAAQAYDENDEVRQAMEDLSLSNNVAPAGTAWTGRCDKYRMRMPTPFYVYFVLDVDGPGDYEEAVEKYVSEVAKRFEQAFPGSADFRTRIGITNTIVENRGRLVSEGGWIPADANVERLVEKAATDCEPTADWTCQGTRDGLATIENGLRQMDSRSDPSDKSVRMKPPGDRALALVIISDEEPASIRSGERTAESYRTFLEGHRPDILQVIGPQKDCGNSQRLATAYGDIGAGSVDDYCQMAEGEAGLNTVSDAFAFSGTGTPSTLGGFHLSDTPITNSLRTFQNDTFVPRSGEDGFRYFAYSNNAVLVGSFSPYSVDPWEAPYFNAFRYYSWGDGTDE